MVNEKMLRNGMKKWSHLKSPYFKKVGILPQYVSEEQLYYKAKNTVSRQAFYLVNMLNQVYKKSCEIDYTTENDFNDLANEDDLWPHVVNNCVHEVHQKLLQIIQNAFDKKSSDIHFIPRKKHLDIFFRQQGDLVFTESVETKLQCALINLIKLKAKMNTIEVRRPQNGQFVVVVPSGKVCCRVASLPCLHGESVVVRLQLEELCKNYDYSLLDKLPFVHYFKKKLPGLWLITGPIGHGKTTTYYRLLTSFQQRRVISLEDPIEMPKQQLVQLVLDERYYSDCFMRDILRQSVDVVGIGEIRTREQLKLAVNTALTGHCVLSTFHAGSLKDVYMRLENFGYSHEQQKHFLKAVLFQRWEKTPTRHLIFEASDIQH